VRRREFIAAAGALAGLPLAVRAQTERVRQIGMLSEFFEAQMQPLVEAFRGELNRRGWKQDAFNIDLRFAITDAAQFNSTAAAIVATNPDVIVALGSRALRALKDESQTIPIVFTLVADPVAQGLVKSLARPDGNFTGLTNYEYSFPGKWVDALKEIEPRIKRILLIVNPQNSGTLALAKAVEAMGPDYGVEMVRGEVRTVADIDTVLEQFGAGADRLSGRSGREQPRDPDRAHQPRASSGGVSVPLLHPERRAVVLGTRFRRRLPAGRGLCRSAVEGREALGLADPGAQQVRSFDQPEDGESAGLQHAADFACSRRRGDRVEGQ
jgi:hypothetical protein